jgi:DNA-binding transcriptional ArsR family regulator
MMTHIPPSLAGDALASLVELLRALADTNRFRIYQYLRQGEACVCEISSALELAENLVSYHLSTLRRVHLILDRRDPEDARWIYYRINRERLALFVSPLDDLFNPDTIGTREPSCGPTNPILPRRPPSRIAQGETS